MKEENQNEKADSQLKERRRLGVNFFTAVGIYNEL